MKSALGMHVAVITLCAGFAAPSLAQTARSADGDASITSGSPVRRRRDPPGVASAIIDDGRSRPDAGELREALRIVHDADAVVVAPRDAFAELKVAGVEDRSGVTFCVDSGSPWKSHWRHCHRFSGASLAPSPWTRRGGPDSSTVDVPIVLHGRLHDALFDGVGRVALRESDAPSPSVVTPGAPLFDAPWSGSIAEGHAAMERYLEGAIGDYESITRDTELPVPPWASVLDHAESVEVTLIAREGARRAQVLRTRDAEGATWNFVLLRSTEGTWRRSPAFAGEVSAARFTDLLVPGSLTVRHAVYDRAPDPETETAWSSPVRVAVLVPRDDRLELSDTLVVGEFGFALDAGPQTRFWRWWYAPVLTADGSLRLEHAFSYQATRDAETGRMCCESRFDAPRRLDVVASTFATVRPRVASSWRPGRGDRSPRASAR